MDLRPIPILIPPWVARRICENNFDISRITDLVTISKFLDPIDIAATYLLNDKTLSFFSLYRPMRTFNALNEFWRDIEEPKITALFSEKVAGVSDYGSARINTFLESKEIYKNVSNNQRDVDYDVSTLPVSFGNVGAVFIVVYNPMVLKDFAKMDELTCKFFGEYIKFSGVQRNYNDRFNPIGFNSALVHTPSGGFRSITQSCEIWSRYLNILERR